MNISKAMLGTVILFGSLIFTSCSSEEEDNLQELLQKTEINAPSDSSDSTGSDEKKDNDGPIG